MATKKATTKKAAKATTKKAAEVREVVNQIEAKIGGVESIGWQVWWDLREVDGDHSQLDDALKAMGCEDCTPEMEPPVRRMVNAAVRIHGRHGVIIKKAGKENGFVVFRPVGLEKTSDATATEDKPTFDPKVMSPIAVNEETGETRHDPSCEIAVSLVAEYKRQETRFTSRRLRRSILAVIDKHHGLRMRKQGGVYFVPTSHEATEHLTDLQAFVRTIGECDLYMPQLPNTDEWTRSAQRAALNSLDGQYNDVLAEVEGFVRKMDAGDLVHGRALSAKISATKNLQNRAELYREILADRGERLSQASEIVSDAMKQIVEATAEVRALQRAGGSERAQDLAKSILGEIAKKTAEMVSKAKEAHAPSIDDDDDDDE